MLLKVLLVAKSRLDFFFSARKTGKNVSVFFFAFWKDDFEGQYILFRISLCPS